MLHKPNDKLDYASKHGVILPRYSSSEKIELSIAEKASMSVGVSIADFILLASAFCLGIRLHQKLVKTVESTKRKKSGLEIRTVD